jgi:hypothetical protein
VKANMIKLACAALAVAAAAGCGEVSRNGRSPAQVVITALEGAAGATPDEFGGTLDSDVVTVVQRTIGGEQVDSPTIFSDVGRVSMRLTLRDPGIPGAASAPSLLNEVTFTRYRVTYRRSDGRNAPGVDVPHPFDSAVTFTVPADGNVTAGFEIVRHSAKLEAPLLALSVNGVLISTVADVTFYGRDQTGNEVSVTGSIGIIFGNFGDPS